MKKGAPDSKIVPVSEAENPSFDAAAFANSAERTHAAILEKLTAMGVKREDLPNALGEADKTLSAIKELSAKYARLAEKFGDKFKPEEKTDLESHIRKLGVKLEGSISRKIEKAAKEVLKNRATTLVQPEPAPAVAAERDHDVQTGIEEAALYLGFGRNDQAREILQKLIGHGNDAQRAEMIRLLDTIENEDAIFGAGAGRPAGGAPEAAVTPAPGGNAESPEDRQRNIEVSAMTAAINKLYGENVALDPENVLRKFLDAIPDETVRESIRSKGLTISYRGFNGEVVPRNMTGALMFVQLADEPSGKGLVFPTAQQIRALHMLDWFKGATRAAGFISRPGEAMLVHDKIELIQKGELSDSTPEHQKENPSGAVAPELQQSQDASYQAKYGYVRDRLKSNLQSFFPIGEIPPDVWQNLLSLTDEHRRNFLTGNTDATEETERKIDAFINGQDNAARARNNPAPPEYKRDNFFLASDSIYTDIQGLYPQGVPENVKGEFNEISGNVQYDPLFNNTEQETIDREILKRREVLLREQREAVGNSNRASESSSATPEAGAEPAKEQISELEARLNVAREALIEAEQKIKVDFGFVPKEDPEYNKALEIYEKARAELVGGEISLFLKEETTLADSRILAATEKKAGTWGKISSAYKWLGEQNLGKWTGWKPEGLPGRIVARGVNVRMGIGATLLGIGFFAPPVFLLTLGAKRAMSGVGAAVFTNDWLKAKTEASLTTLSEKKLNSMNTYDIAECIGDMTVGLRMQGKLASQSADFQKLMARYEELLKKEYESLHYKEVYLSGESSYAIRKFRWAHAEEKFKKFLRGGASVGAGALAAVGVDIFRHLNGVQDTGLFGAAKAPAELPSRPPVMDVPKPPVEAGTEAVKPDVSAPASAPEALAGQPSAEAAGQEAAGENAPKPQAAEGTRSENAQAAAEKEQSQGAPKETVENKTGEIKPDEAAAKAEVEEISKPEIPNSFEITVQAGEGPIHEARKAISEYIAFSGDEQLKGLTKAQRILAEEKLYRAVKDSLPKWKIGAVVSFDKDIIEKTLGEVSGQTQEQIAALDKNLAPFIDKVKWARYDVQLSQEGDAFHKPWEFDEGIRHVSKATVTGGELVSPDNATIAQGEARLDEFILRNEEERYIPDNIAGEGNDEATLDELILQNDEVAKAQAIGGADPALSQSMLEEASQAKEAALDSAVERTAKTISRIYPDEYRAIKDVKISDVLKKGYLGTTPETSWPSAGGPNQVDVIKKMKLRDSFIKVMEAFSPEERGRASGMTIHKFIQEYYKDRILKGSTG